jgi:hypothetical protein
MFSIRSGAGKGKYKLENKYVFINTSEMPVENTTGKFDISHFQLQFLQLAFPFTHSYSYSTNLKSSG